MTFEPCGNGPMLARERRQITMQMLQERGSVRVTDLADALGVSQVTVRSDLTAMQDEGLLTRDFGGATLNVHPGVFLSFIGRTAQNSDLKRRIGKVAGSLVQDGDTIIIESGSTTAEMIPYLVERSGLTVVTNGIPIASTLASAPDITVVMTGGVLNPKTLSLQGPSAERTFSEHYVDKLFMGVQGIDFERGLTEANAYAAQLKQAMIRSARKVVLLADSSKYESVAFASVGPLTMIHQAVVVEGVSQDIIARLKELGIEVTLA